MNIYDGVRAVGAGRRRSSRRRGSGACGCGTAFGQGRGGVVGVDVWWNGVVKSSIPYKK